MPDIPNVTIVSCPTTLAKRFFFGDLPIGTFFVFLDDFARAGQEVPLHFKTSEVLAFNLKTQNFVMALDPKLEILLVGELEIKGKVSPQA